MKISKLFSYVSIILIVIILFSVKSYSQSIIKPHRALWVADNQVVEISEAMNTGIKKPAKLTLLIAFKKSIEKKYLNKSLNLQFQWYKYYATGKDLMETYNYESIKDFKIHEKALSVSSTCKNISTGTWEVIITAKIEKEIVSLGNAKRYLIKIK